MELYPARVAGRPVLHITHYRNELMHKLLCPQKRALLASSYPTYATSFSGGHQCCWGIW